MMFTIHQSRNMTVRSQLKLAYLHTVMEQVIALWDSQRCGSEETKSAC
jgi:hypothetical protein